MAVNHDLEQPLLEKEEGVVLHPDCPGCKAAYLRDPDAPIPFKKLAIVAALTLVNGLPNSSLYPFLYFMVRDFHIAKSDKDIGFFAGFLGSVLMLGRFLTGVPWGMVADKIGRKPVIIIGVSSVIVFHTMFGLSTTFWMALFSRFMLGCCNGLIGTIKAYASEICSETHQALSASITGTIWALSLILGPALGGYLSQPAIKFPDFFPPNSLFDQFPYLLPSLSVTAVAIPVFFISFQLPETLHKHGSSEKISKATPKGCQGNQVYDFVDSTKEEVKVMLEKESDHVYYHEEGQKKKSLLTSKPFIAALLLYGVTCLNDIAFTEIFSLWCVSPRVHGGLGLQTTDVGQILAISGFVMMMFQIFAFLPLLKCMGAVLVPRIAGFIGVPLMVALIFVPMLHETILWATLCLAAITKNILSAMILTSSIILINNSVTQAERGAANGVGMSVSSFFSAIAPAGGGSLFAWAQSRQDAYILPGNQLVFFCMAVTSLVVAIPTFEPFIPRSLAKPLPVDEEEKPIA